MSLFDEIDNMDNPNMQYAIACDNQFETCNINSQIYSKITKIDKTNTNTTDATADTTTKSYHMKCVSTKDLNDDEMEVIFKLLKTNMKAMYMKTWGWKDSEKRKELFSPGRV